MSVKLDLLVVSPHPDDAEISVGGTILKSRAAGMKVGVLDLTNGEPTPHGSPEIRAEESAKATEILKLDWRENLGLPNRSLQNDLSSRRKLAEVFRKVQPEYILAPYWEDVHPDHVVASQLVDDARFWSKLTKIDMEGDPYWPPYIFYFWSIHLRIHPQPSFVVDISDHIDTKMEAIKSYQSQLITGRSQDHPTVIDDIKDRARYWGWSIYRSYGEPFASREALGVDGLQSLL